MKSEIVVKDGAVYHLGLRADQLAPQIILVGDPARTESVASFFDRIEHRASHREYVTITGTYKGMSVSVIGTGMSTDNIEIALMEIYTLLAFDLNTHMRKAQIPNVTIIRVGTSGGVQADILPGTFGISNYALGLDSTGLYFEHPPDDEVVTRLEADCLRVLNENTPRHFRFYGKLIPYGSKASELIVHALEQQAKIKDAAFVTGVTSTTPGFYGPSARFMEGVQNSVPDIKSHLAKVLVDDHRIINMEMESSLLFHLGSILGFRCGTICPIISNPSTPNVVIDYQRLVSEAIEVGLEAMREVCGI